MANLYDAPADGGNANRAIEALSAPDAPQPTKVEVKSSDSKQDPRFANKSANEIIEMYRNLESHQGRLANDLGQTRRTLDQLLLEKREADLRGQGVQEPTKVSTTDLLQDPNAALDDFVNSRLTNVLKPFQDKIGQLEAALATVSFRANHADYESVSNDPSFKRFTDGTALRQQLAATAASGNLQAADALLTEYKDYKAKTTQVQRVDDAANVSFESSRANDVEATGKRYKYRRSDLIRLKMDNPDKYDDLSGTITDAYTKGLVNLDA